MLLKRSWISWKVIKDSDVVAVSILGATKHLEQKISHPAFEKPGFLERPGFLNSNLPPVEIIIEWAMLTKEIPF